MRKIVFDIETKNTFSEVNSTDVTDLDLSLIAIHDSETEEYYSYFQEDLPELWPRLEKADLLIGYNSDHFDIPLLNKYYPGDLTAIKSLDILKEIKKSIGRRIKLDQVAEGTLNIKKSGHGLEAVKWWKDGELDKIKKYCLDDVRITKEVYDFAIENGLLKYKEGSKLSEIKLDTSNWEQISNQAMNHTLPF